MSRIREQYDLTGDNTTAVATGLQRTGGIITSAALLLLVVIGAFSLSGITFIKMIGVAMLIAVVIDATIVRILLVPATMRLLGRRQLVRARARCAGSTRGTGSGSPTANRAAGRRPRTGRHPLTPAEPDLPLRKVRPPARSDGRRRPAPRAPAGGAHAEAQHRLGVVVRRWRGASRTRRGGSGDGGISLPQPTQYRPRCSTALQWCTTTWCLLEWTSPWSGLGGPSQVRTTELGSSRRVGRPVTGPSPGQTLEQPVEEGDLALHQLRARLVDREPGRPVDLGELLHAAPSAAATPARRCC